MKNLNFSHLLLLVISFYTLTTTDSHNFSLIPLQTLYVFTQHTHFLLKHTLFLFHTSYTILSEFVFLFDCFKQYLTNYMTILTPVSKSLITPFLNIITPRILKNGFLFSYMTVLNVRKTNTLT